MAVALRPREATSHEGAAVPLIEFCPEGQRHDRVWVRSEVLREARLRAGRRLADVAEGIMSVATLSRLETGGNKPLMFSVATRLVAQLGIPAPGNSGPEGWPQRIVDEAVIAMRRWDYRQAVHILSVRNLFVDNPAAPDVELRARVIAYWAAWHAGEGGRPDGMLELGDRAAHADLPEVRSVAAAFAGTMYECLGDLARAGAILSGAIREMESGADRTSYLCALSSQSRVQARAGQAERALETVQDAASLLTSGAHYAQARFLHTRGALEAAAARSECAEETLRRSVAVAGDIPNPALAGVAELTLWSLYKRRGDQERADAAAMRAVRGYLEGGQRQKALDVLQIVRRPQNGPCWVTIQGW